MNYQIRQTQSTRYPRQNATVTVTRVIGTETDKRRAQKIASSVKGEVVSV